MPQFIVTGPDNKKWKVDAPSGSTENDAIDYVTSEHYAPQSPSKMESLGRGSSDSAIGFTQTLANLGFRPEAVNSAFNPQIVIPENDFTASSLNTTLANSEQDYQSRRGPNAGIDYMRGAGEILGTLPLMFAGGAPTTLGRVVTTGMGQGAFTGVTMPVTNGGDFASEKAKQIGIGTVTGGIASPFMTVLSKMVTGIGDRTVKSLLDRGIRLTPGQMLGRSATNIEDQVQAIVPFVSGAKERVVKDFNRASFDQALSPIGVTVGNNTGRQGVKAGKKVISQAYDDALADVVIQGDSVFGNELNAVAQKASRLAPDQANEFTRIIRDKVAREFQETGTITGQTFKSLESELNTISRNAKRSEYSSQRDFGAAIEEVLESLRNSLVRSNPEKAETLKAINAANAAFSDVRRATVLAKSNAGEFTPGQLISSIAQGDKSRNKDIFASGGYQLQQLAEDAQKVIGNKIPDSGTAGRLGMQLAATGGLGFVSPEAAIGIGTGSLMYTKPGQRAIQTILTGGRGGPVNDFVARALQRSAPAIGLGGANLVAGNQ